MKLGSPGFASARRAARLRFIVAVSWLLALGALTLSPQPPVSRFEPALEQTSTCLICGEYGTADAILNLLLFIPLGLLLAPRPGALLRAAVLGLAMSTFIEVAQHFIPGRYSNLGDVTWNTAGAWLGAAIWSVRHRWLPQVPGEAAWLGSAAVAGASVAVFAFGWLMEPDWPRDRYWGQWTPDLGYMEQYEGRVIRARLDSASVPPGPFPDDVDPRALLEKDWILEATVVSGPRSAALAPIVNLYDAHRREVVLLGASGEDLVYREWTWARQLRFSQPALRFSGAFSGTAPGDTIRIGVARRGSVRCLALGRRRECPGLTPGRAWSLLLESESRPLWARPWLDGVWMFLLLLPIGFWSRRPGELAARGVLGTLACVGGILLTRLIAPPWTEWAGVVLGLLVGHALRALVGSWLRKAARYPTPA